VRYASLRRGDCAPRSGWDEASEFPLTTVKMLGKRAARHDISSEYGGAGRAMWTTCSLLRNCLPSMARWASPSRRTIRLVESHLSCRTENKRRNIYFPWPAALLAAWAITEPGSARMRVARAPRR